MASPPPAPLVILTPAAPEVEPAPQGQTELPRLPEAQTVALLRGHLMQLLPCDKGVGHLDLVAVTGPDGALVSLNVDHTNPAERTADADTLRCVLSRVAWWRFPKTRHPRTEVAFAIDFPLTPPTLLDHVAVLSGGGGTVDLPSVTQELRRLRPQVLGCFKGRRQEDPLAVLLWLRLGEWGKLLDFGMEERPFAALRATGLDSGAPSHGAQEREQRCLHTVLRLAQFPNPVGGDVRVRFPLVR